jgi:hypothetical protein
MTQLSVGLCSQEKVLATVTLSPQTKCGVVDGFEQACISSLCSCNTERTTIACNSCNNFNRYDASCETGIKGRMPNSR